MHSCLNGYGAIVRIRNQLWPSVIVQPKNKKITVKAVIPKMRIGKLPWKRPGTANVLNMSFCQMGGEQKYIVSFHAFLSAWNLSKSYYREPAGRQNFKSNMSICVGGKWQRNDEKCISMSSFLLLMSHNVWHANTKGMEIILQYHHACLVILTKLWLALDAADVI